MQPPQVSSVRSSSRNRLSSFAWEYPNIRTALWRLIRIHFVSKWLSDLKSSQVLVSHNILFIKFRVSVQHFCRTHIKDPTKPLFPVNIRTLVITPWAWARSPWHIQHTHMKDVKKTHRTAWIQHINLTLYGTEKKTREWEEKAPQNIPIQIYKFIACVGNNKQRKPKQQSLWSSFNALFLPVSGSPLFSVLGLERTHT